MIYLQENVRNVGSLLRWVKMGHVYSVMQKFVGSVGLLPIMCVRFAKNKERTVRDERYTDNR